jgi:hypothetical protein
MNILLLVSGGERPRAVYTWSYFRGRKSKSRISRIIRISRISRVSRVLRRILRRISRMPMGMARMAAGSLSMTAASHDRGVSRYDPRPESPEGPVDMTVSSAEPSVMNLHRQVGWGWFIFSIIQILIGVGMTCLGFLYL